MTARLVLLLVDSGPELELAFGQVLASEPPEARLTVARDAHEALEQARQVPPEALVLGPTVDEQQAERLRRELEDPITQAALPWAWSPARATAADRLRAVQAGAEALLSWPPDPVEVREALCRLVAARDRVRRERDAKAEIDRLRGDAQERLRSLVELLGRMADMVHPGAIERGARRAERARIVSARFEIPERLVAELDIAARLHELGRVVAPSSSGDVTDDERVAAESLAAATLLDPLPGMSGVAEVLGLQRENWDGTGHPGRLQQGQIPLRSRILRVLVDLERLLTRTRRLPLAEALAELDAHGGTLYDPLVLVHVTAALGVGDPGTADRDLQRVAVDELAPGMVLGEDLMTDAGMKLLARGTRLSPESLEVLLRRHQIDPILRGAVIRVA